MVVSRVAIDEWSDSHAVVRRVMQDKSCSGLRKGISYVRETAR